MSCMWMPIVGDIADPTAKRENIPPAGMYILRETI